MKTSKQKINRRDFVKKIIIGGAVISLGNAGWPTPTMASANSKIDIGSCRSVKITCISEIGWHDTDQMLDDIKAGGGVSSNQWEMNWHSENGAGSSSLIEVELSDGRWYRILLDVGWNPEYMMQRFSETGVDDMLKNGAIDLVMISHEHLDHLWGLEAVLRLRPDIAIALPATFKSEGLSFIQGRTFPAAGAKNLISHTGSVIQYVPGGVHKIVDGVAAKVFDLPIILGIHGEQSLYVNVENRGIVCITGCCHQTITRFADFAQDHLIGGDKLYGLYGGLHIAPFGPLTDEAEATIQNMGAYGFKKMACNHCTGTSAVESMIKKGYPIVRGTGRSGSQSDLYIGNGDQVSFG